MSESEGSRKATEDDGKPSESDTIQKIIKFYLNHERYQKVQIEIRECENKLWTERESYNATWALINSKEKSVKDLEKKIETLQHEIAALVIEESSIADSMKRIQQKKEALEKELSPFQMKN
ncbi:hypothetical protein I4U23_006151 [Adineta vaga]|nr:hypothetical protein I4U23_006151 [Adineta vaga]